MAILPATRSTLGMDLAKVRIADISVHVTEIPYRSVFRISRGDSPVLTSVFVRIGLDDGRGSFGWGETSPMTAYTGETTVGVADAISRELGPAVIGASVFDLADVHARMNGALRGRSVPKAAVDLACVDAQGRLSGLPAWALLGGRARPTVRLAWAIGLGEIDEVVQECSVRVAQGFRHIKVKGGVDADRDVRLVEQLSGSLRGRAEFSLDANGGYDRTTALPALRAMERCGMTLIEQPLPDWDIAGMADLTARLDLPVMADESADSVAAILELTRRRACRIVNIKLLKFGGLYGARQGAIVAAAGGLDVKVGSMPELGLSTLAGLHFAAATPAATVPADLIGPMLAVRDVLIDPSPTQSRDGVLTVPDTPGLGGEPAAAELQTTGGQTGVTA